MAAKMNGTFELDDNMFGGQNIGVEESEEMKNKLQEKGYDVDKIIDELQKKLISGNFSIPDNLKRESFIDD